MADIIEQKQSKIFDNTLDAAMKVLEIAALNLGGESHKVTKRIYRFIGNNQTPNL